LFQENYLDTKGGMSRSIRQMKVRKTTSMGMSAEQIAALLESEKMQEEAECENLKQ